jgi:hypothetical protein
MTTYKIMRFFRPGSNKQARAIRHGLSLEEAKRHCNRSDAHKIDKKGEIVWFEGFTAED